MIADDLGAGRIVAIVEDNERNARLADEVLRAHGFVTTVYTTGADALVGMAQRRPDLVLLDVQLPDMDGVEVLAHLRVLWASPPPAVAVTAYAMNGDRQRFLDAGFDDYLAKPLEVASLAARLLAVIERSG